MGRRVSRLLDVILPQLSPQQSITGMFFVILGFMGFAMISKLGEEGCNVLMCQSAETSTFIGTLLLVVFMLPSALAGFSGYFLQAEALVMILFLVSLPVSLLYSLYITKPVLWVGNRSSYWIGKAIRYLESDKEPEMERIEFFERFGIQLIMLFSLFFAMVAFLYYPEIQVKLGLTEFLLLATANTAITTYVLKLFEENIEEDAKWMLKRISFFVLIMTLLGAGVVFLTENSAGQSSLVDKASFSALKMFIVTTVLGGFASMVYFPMMALSEEGKDSSVKPRN